MAVKQNIVASANSTQALTFSKLRGVDYSSSPFEVSSTRAVSIKNIINEDGVNHKRCGWTTDLAVNKNGVKAKIYDICELGDKYCVVATLNNTTSVSLYIWDGSSKLEVAQFLLNIGDSSYDEVPEKILVPMGANKVFVIGMSNNPVMILYNKQNSTYEVKTDAFYIPTTSISINASDELEKGATAFEEKNMLTNKRKNSLIGKTKETVLVTFVSKSSISYISGIDLRGMVSTSPITENIISFSANKSDKKSSISFRVLPAEYIISASLTDGDGYDLLYDENNNLIGEDYSSGYGDNVRKVNLVEDTIINIMEG